MLTCFTGYTVPLRFSSNFFFGPFFTLTAKLLHFKIPSGGSPSRCKGHPHARPGFSFQPHGGPKKKKNPTTLVLGWGQVNEGFWSYFGCPAKVGLSYVVSPLLFFFPRISAVKFAL